MATIKDVAAAAGVSVGTVSRVLAKNATVAGRLRERVEAAVRDLGYKPNLAARSLRTNKASIIGFLVPDITNPFFAQLAKHVETAAARRGLAVILANTHDDPATERQQLQALLDHNPLGVIVVAAADSGLGQFDAHARIVALDRDLAGHPCIRTDHEKSAALAAAHLLDLGHRRIGYIAGPQDTAVARARRKGFALHLDAWRAQGGAACELEVHEGAFSYAAGEAIGRLLLDRPARDRPTAIAAASDQQAIGAMRSARDLGVAAPRDLSIVGFDDIDLASVVIPRLTTIRQPAEALAVAAVDAVLSPAGRRAAPDLFARLVARGSSGPAPGG